MKSYWGAGKYAYKQGRYHHALHALTQALELDTYHPYAYWYRGATHVALGNNQAALIDYDRAIAMMGDEKPTLYGYRADTYQQLGRYQEALDDYNRMLAIEQARTQRTYTQRGRVFFLMGDYAAALANWDYAETLDGDEPWLPIYRGLAYAQQHEFLASQLAFSQAQQSEEGMALHHLATLLVEGYHAIQTKVVITQARFIAATGR